MPVLEQDITGETPSADFSPTEMTSMVIITGDFPKLQLECIAPSGTKYATVTKETGAFSVDTPVTDGTVKFRFRGLSPDTSAHVYMGP